MVLPFSMLHDAFSQVLLKIFLYHPLDLIPLDLFLYFSHTLSFPICLHKLFQVFEVVVIAKDVFNLVEPFPDMAIAHFVCQIVFGFFLCALARDSFHAYFPSSQTS